MTAKTGKDVEISFDPGVLGLDQIRHRADDIWSDLAFDEPTLARLKRDGLALDGVRLTGPNPFRIAPGEGGQMRVAAPDHPHAEILLDLWRLHFMKGLRPSSFAA